MPNIILAVIFVDGIVKYMKTKSGPSTKNLDSLEAAEKFFKFPETAVVGKYISNSFYLLT